MKDLVIKGLKKVSGQTKAIGLGEKGIITYDKVSKSVSFDGFWDARLDVKITGAPDTEVNFWVTKPMTMREIKKMIAPIVDYDLYVEMDLEDRGIYRF